MRLGIIGGSGLYALDALQDVEWRCVDTPFGSYLGLGLGSSAQRGAVDLDYFGYKPGLILPSSFNDPVGFTALPTNVTLASGYTASFGASVTGAPPYYFQWYRDGAAITDATNATYVTPPVVLADGDQIVGCGMGIVEKDLGVVLGSR